MADTPSKIPYPTGADTFDPAADMELIARGIVHIVPVANQTERNTVAATYTPTPNKPLFVNRGDTGAIERNTGDGWVQIHPATAVAARRWGAAARNVPNDTAIGHSFAGGELTYSGGVITGGIGNGFVLPVAGWYALSAAVRWGAAGGGGLRQTRITVNDNAVVQVQDGAVNNMVQNPAITGIYLEAGATIGLIVYQNSGATVSTNPGVGDHPFISASLLGR